jgi:hypothetical protein
MKMASGCIVGDCPVCDYPVFEDEWSDQVYERTGEFVHIGKCVNSYRTKAHLISENERLRKDLEEYKKRFEDR